MFWACPSVGHSGTNCLWQSAPPFPSSGRAIRYIFFGGGGGAAAPKKGCRSYPSRGNTVTNVPKKLTNSSLNFSKRILKELTQVKF
ncbi:MAG TPA: hypothetical protein DCL65_11200 [Chryseobacterium sp.]|nr:hypothetical protein [Chryseobacterium sp.]